MSSVSSSRHRYNPKHTEICIGNIGSYIEPNLLLNYFQKFGNITHCSFTSSTGGFVFITYEDVSMVDACMADEPHHLNGRCLYVKRSLPVDDEHPRERFETARDLMIVLDLNDEYYSSDRFLTELRKYFSSYGKLYACRYCEEENFSYILVEFLTKDQVDRIILDKPHYYNEYELNVMKCIPSNIDIMNQKYSVNKQRTGRLKANNMNKKEPISEIALEKEVYRLQNTLTTMNEAFALQRRQLEDDCSEQLKKINENVEKTYRLQQDLEQEYTILSTEYESTKRENDELNEQYLIVELENFEITSYYEQILAEEKAKTVQLEAEYKRKLKTLHDNPSSSSLKSQLQPTISNDQ